MLGAPSVGLVLEGAEESVLAVPPAVSVVVVTAADSGARGCSWGAGVPMTAAGAGGGGAAGVETTPTEEAEGLGDVVVGAAIEPAGVMIC